MPVPARLGQCLWQRQPSCSTRHLLSSSAPERAAQPVSGCSFAVLGRLHGGEGPAAARVSRLALLQPQPGARRRLAAAARKAAAPEPPDSDTAKARSLDVRIFALLLPAMLTVLLEPTMAIIDAGTPISATLPPRRRLLAWAGADGARMQPLWAAWARCP